MTWCECMPTLKKRCVCCHSLLGCHFYGRLHHLAFFADTGSTAACASALVCVASATYFVVACASVIKGASAEACASADLHQIARPFSLWSWQHLFCYLVCGNFHHCCFVCGRHMSSSLRIGGNMLSDNCVNNQTYVGVYNASARFCKDRTLIRSLSPSSNYSFLCRSSFVCRPRWCLCATFGLESSTTILVRTQFYFIHTL